MKFENNYISFTLQVFGVIFIVLLALYTIDNFDGDSDSLVPLSSEERSSSGGRIDYISKVKNCQNLERSKPKVSGEIKSSTDITDTQFKVVNILEQSWEDSPALAVVFSKPISSSQNFKNLFTVFLMDRKGKTVLEKLTANNWILNQSRDTAYLPFVDPGKVYSIKVSVDLQSSKREKLPGDFTKKVKTRNTSASVGFLSCGSLFSPKLADGIPVKSINVSDINVDFWKIRPSKIINFFSDGERESVYDLRGLNNFAEMVYSSTLSVNKYQKNKSFNSIISINKIDQLKEPGVYFLIMKGAGDYPYSYATTWFSISEVGVQVRKTKDKLSFFTHSFLTSKPLPNSTVQIHFRKKNTYTEAKTGTQGFLEYNRSDQETIAIVKNNNSLSVVPLNEQLIDLGEFGFPVREQNEIEFFLYGARSIYRPGEEVTINGILRDFIGKTLPKALKLRAFLIDPTGDIVNDFYWRAEDDETAFYSTQFKTSVDDKTGKWRLKVSLGNTFFDYYFQLEDFLPEKIKLTLTPTTTESSPFLSHSENLEIKAQAIYLYGSPASGNQWKANIQVRPIRTFDHYFKRNDFFGNRDALGKMLKYVFGQEGLNKFDLDFTIDNQSLDNNGEAIIGFDNNWSSTPVPLRVVTTVDVFSPGGRPINRNVSQIVVPNNGLVGIKPLYADKVAKPHSQITFEIAKFEKDGSYGSGIYNVEISHVSDNYFLSRQRRWRYSKSTTEKVIFLKTIKLNGTTKKFDFFTRYGDYIMVVKKKDGEVINTFHFFAGWKWDRKSNNFQEAPNKIKLSWNKEEYAPGEQAILSFKPPFSGRAIVMVESDHILWKKEVIVEAKEEKVMIPIGDWKRNDNYASVYMVRPLLNLKKADNPFPDISKRSFGLIHVPMLRSHLNLNPEIVVSDKVSSGSTLKTKIKIDKKFLQDKKVFATLAAVDSGILSINNYRTPDPFDYFFSKRKYLTEIIDNYGEIIRPINITFLQERFGGSDTENINFGGDKPVSDVQIVSLFSEPTAFNSEGEATVSFELPDFNGEVRLMAMVYDNSRVGSAEKEVKIVSPLITDVSYPRFIAYQDKTEATLHIENNTDEKKSYNIQFYGSLNLGSQNINTEVRLVPNEKKILKLPLQPSDPTGYGIIHLTIEEISSSKDKFHLTKEWKLAIRPVFPSEAFTVSEPVKPKTAKTLSLPQLNQMLPVGRKALLSLSDKPPIDFNEYLENLINYPYGCLEQTSSRVFPLLLVNNEDLKKYDNIYKKNILSKKPELIKNAIVKLVGMQKINGGFGLWEKNSPEEHWLTAFVLDLFMEAKNQGYPVPQATLEKGISRLQAYVKQPGGVPNSRQHYSYWPKHYTFSYQAYAALVLSKLGQVRLSSLRTIFDSYKGNAKSPLPLAQFALAFEQVGDMKRAEEAWGMSLNYTDRIGRRYGGAYGSDVRDLALSMAYAQKSKLTISFINRIYELEELIKQRRWLSTQENLAIFQLAKAMELSKNVNWQAKLDFFKKNKKYNQAGTLNLFANQELKSSIQIENLNDFNLFATYKIQGYMVNPTYDIAEGISVNRKYFDKKGNKINLSSLKTGELVLVQVMVNSLTDFTIPNAMLVDLLPAGLELENQNLNHSVKMDDFLILGERVETLKKNFPLAHREFRDDRYIAAFELKRGNSYSLFYLVRAVTPGEYSVPPSFVEDMYRPYLRAIGKKEQPLHVEAL